MDDPTDLGCSLPDLLTFPSVPRTKIKMGDRVFLELVHVRRTKIKPHLRIFRALHFDIADFAFIVRTCRSCQRRPFPPDAMMHFPLFQIPPISETFFRLRGRFANLTFRKKLLDFHPPKTFLMTCFSHRLQICVIFSLFFAVSVHSYISPISKKNIPLLLQISPIIS